MSTEPGRPPEHRVRRPTAPADHGATEMGTGPDRATATPDHRMHLPGGRIRPIGPARSARPAGSSDRGHLRGPLVGTAVMVLAVAAHGLAGGGFPDSTALMLLSPAAVLGGMFAGAISRGTGNFGRAALFAALAGGQLIGHAVLAGTITHDHGPAHGESNHAADVLVLGVHLPAGWMLLAHGLATLLCTVLIVAADRLYALVSQAIRVVVGAPAAPPPRYSRRWPGFVAPARRSLRDVSIGPRAPPVSA
ncbi:hypothetical protein [Nocardia sp. BMG51109]|uniref:hypothetical protein n=1 Tax=Nocardia sp. BMG51109 TaxID=1056816 RepID=UPI000463848A|nr:hypothetical protein [Nocardia sp. BMG51109]